MTDFTRDYVITDLRPMIVAGAPPDSPAMRVDPNTTTSPFAGVVSIEIMSGLGTFLCSGAPFTSLRILSAAHCLDLDDNGTIDVLPSAVTVHFNFGTNLSDNIVASGLAVHPDWTGFANPSVNDDLAVITLSSPVPAGIPIYPLYPNPVLPGDMLTLVGYGTSGDGVSGFFVGASFTVKRSGKNVADLFGLDDEAPFTAIETFAFDFDDPAGVLGFVGGPSLGNTIEATLGPGDSGGPAFFDDGGTLKIAGVNTFGFALPGGPAIPLFGSGAGGILIHPYTAFLIPEPSSLVLLGMGIIGLGTILWKHGKRGGQEGPLITTRSEG
jgi:hypothetical protein